MEKRPFSFPIVYTIAFRDNTYLPNVYTQINCLLKGYKEHDTECQDDPLSEPMANHYATGRKHLNPNLRSAFLYLNDEEIIRRIELSQPIDIKKASAGIMALLQDTETLIDGNCSVA